MSQRFGRSLTLPGNEFVEESRCDDIYRGGLALPVKAYPPLVLRGENTFTTEFVMIVIATYAVRDPFIQLGKTQETGFEIDVKS